MKRKAKRRVPPQLRRFAFKKGRRRVALKRKRAVLRIARRRRNPLQAPAPPSHYIFARRGGGGRLHYNGVKMTSNGRPAFFNTKAQAESVAKDLIRKFPILRTYDVYVTDRATKH